MRRHYRRRYRRNGPRDHQNDIATVKIVRRRNPRRRTYHRLSRNAPVSAADLRAMRRILRAHTRVRSNPRRHVKHRRRSAGRSRRKTPKPPKGKRVGSVFKRKGKWFRVGSIKVRKGRRKIRRRVVRKISARAARRARK